MQKPQTELDELLSKAIESQGNEVEANKFYTTFLRSTMYVPIEKIEDESIIDSEEPFRPLFLSHEQHVFMLCFDTLERLKTWSGDYFSEMGYVCLLGRDIIRNIGMRVYLSFNYATEFYKEFAPDEIEKLKQVVGRLDRLAKKT